MRLKFFALASLLILGAAACSKSETTATPTPTVSASPVAKATVNATDSLKFEPASVTLNVGGSIIWTNTGTAPHDVTSTSGSELKLDLGSKATTAPHTFATAGTYDYTCTIHGKSMSGTVIVV